MDPNYDFQTQHFESMTPLLDTQDSSFFHYQDFSTSNHEDINHDEGTSSLSQLSVTATTKTTNTTQHYNSDKSLQSQGTTLQRNSYSCIQIDKYKLERKRERNRIAASKCRQRKIERISTLEKQVNELKGENKKLNDLTHNLRIEICNLQGQLQYHKDNGCNLQPKSKSQTTAEFADSST